MGVCRVLFSLRTGQKGVACLKIVAAPNLNCGGGRPGNNEGNNAPAPAPAPPPEGEGDSPLAAAAAQGQQGPFPPAAKGLNLQGGTHDPAAEPARVLAGMSQPQPPTGQPPSRLQPLREGKGVPGKKFDPTVTPKK